MSKESITTKDLARAYFTGLANVVVTEGAEKDVLRTKFEEEEYNFIEGKIVDYMKRHFDYSIVRNFTQHIPTVATTVAAVLKVSTKTTIITAIASTLIEGVIRTVIAYYMLPVKDICEAAKEFDIDDEDDLFGDSFDDIEDFEDDEDFNFEEVEDEVVDPAVEEMLTSVSCSTVEESDESTLLTKLSEEEMEEIKQQEEAAREECDDFEEPKVED